MTRWNVLLLAAILPALLLPNGVAFCLCAGQWTTEKASGACCSCCKAEAKPAARKGCCTRAGGHDGSRDSASADGHCRHCKKVVIAAPAEPEALKPSPETVVATVASGWATPTVILPAPAPAAALPPLEAPLVFMGAAAPLRI